MANHANHDSFLRMRISFDILAIVATAALIIAAPNFVKNSCSSSWSCIDVSRDFEGVVNSEADQYYILINPYLSGIKEKFIK